MIVMGDFFKVFSSLKSGVTVLNCRRRSIRLIKTGTIVLLTISMVFAVPIIAIATIMTPLKSQTKETMMEKRINSNNDNDIIEWNKTYGTKSADEGNFVSETADGGYIITGTTVSHIPVSNDYNVWLIKTNSTGDLEWNQTYGGTDRDKGFCVEQTTPDGGYIIIGYTYSYGANPGVSPDVWLIKTNSTGDLEWNQTYGGTEYDTGCCVVQTADGGYIITGNKGKTTDPYSGDVWLIKTDVNGNILWDKIFGGLGGDEGRCILQTSDGGFIITGTTRSFGAGFSDVWLIKTDKNGDLLWDKTYGGIYSDYGYWIEQISNSGYIIVGTTEFYSREGYDNDVWLIKTDENGNEEWKRNYGGINFDTGYCVDSTTDGGYIITGCTYFYDEIFGDVWLIKTDEKGNYLWDKTFGGLRSDVGRCVIQTFDGGFIITGTTSSFGAGTSDVWLIKVSNMVVDSDGKESSYSTVAIYIAVGISLVVAAWLGKSLGRMMGFRRKKSSE